MQNIRAVRILPLLMAVLCIVSLWSCCDKQQGVPFFHDECNSVYYWRTDFRLDSLERDFIAKNNIQRMYIRFFDVTAEDNYWMDNRSNKSILPNATLTFSDSVPKSVRHVVPTVYITIEALRSMKGREADAASKIVRRALNMVSYHELPNVDELQLDCDWTESTDSIYFNLCRAVRDTLNMAAHRPMALSSTIRLHQLKKSAPPVDYGVLMCYNTGSFRNPKCRNSILHYDDVEPYLRHTIHYPLHLDLALPIYDWTLCYRAGEFFGIVRADSLFHTSFTKLIENDVNLYRATTNAQMDNSRIREGDVLRHEKSDPETVLRVAELSLRKIEPQPRSIILYHLDSKNIRNFSDNEISQIYSRDSI